MVPRSREQRQQELPLLLQRAIVPKTRAIRSIIIRVFRGRGDIAEQAGIAYDVV